MTPVLPDDGPIRVVLQIVETKLRGVVSGLATSTSAGLADAIL